MDNQQPTSQSNVNKAKKTSSGQSIAAIALIIAIIAVIGLGYIAFMQMRSAKTQSVKQATLQQTVTGLQARVQQQQQVVQASRQALQGLVNERNRDNKDWVLAAAKYLVHLAYYNLEFDHNVPVAIRLLQAADHRVQSLQDPSLLPLRRKLANDISALQAVPKLDLTGIILKLDAVSQQIIKLPLIPTTLPKQADADQQKQDSLWSRGWNKAIMSLKNIVVVRRLETSMKPLMSPSQHGFLIENIQAKLSMAQWAAMHRKPKIYQQSLASAIKWQQRYFLQDATATKNMIAELQTLQKVDLTPTLPDLTATLAAMNGTHVRHEKQQPQKHYTSPLKAKPKQAGPEVLAS